MADETSKLRMEVDSSDVKQGKVNLDNLVTSAVTADEKVADLGNEFQKAGQKIKGSNTGLKEVTKNFKEQNKSATGLSSSVKEVSRNLKSVKSTGLKDVSSNAKKADKSLERLKNQQKKLRSELSKLNRELKKNQNALKKQKEQSDKSGISMGKVAKRLGVLAAAYVTVTSAIQAFNYSMGEVATYERFEDQLVTATGSLESANLQFQSLQRLAATTPFQLQTVVDGFIKLKNLGLDPSERALLSYGNTAAAMGKDIDQLVEAVADASVAEFERLKEFGIKSSKEGDKIRFTFGGVTTTVKNSAEDIQRYLIELGETTFAGGMQRQADNIDTIFSNLSASASLLAAKLSNESGLTNAVKGTAVAFTDLFNSLAGVPREVSEIEAEIEKLQKKLEESTSGSGTRTLQKMIEELRKELNQSRAISNEAEDLEKAVNKIDEQMARYVKVIAEADKEDVQKPTIRKTFLGFPYTADNPVAEEYAEANKELDRLARERAAIIKRLEDVRAQNDGKIKGGGKQIVSDADKNKIEALRAQLSGEEADIKLSYEKRQKLLDEHLAKEAKFQEDYDNLSMANAVKFRQDRAKLEMSANQERFEFADRDLQLEKEAYELRLENLKQFHEDGLISTREYNNQKNAIEDELRNARIETENARYEMEKENLALQKAAGIESIIPYHEREQQLEKEHQRNLNKIKQKGLTEREKFQSLSFGRQLHTGLSALQKFTSMSASEDKKMFRLNQLSGISNAIMSTYQGAAAALEWGWPMGPIFAGLISAAGFKNVQAIKKQKFGSTSTGGGSSVGSASAPSITAPSIPDVQAPDFNNPNQNIDNRQSLQLIFQGPITGLDEDILAEKITDLIERDYITFQ